MHTSALRHFITIGTLVLLLGACRLAQPAQESSIALPTAASAPLPSPTVPVATTIAALPTISATKAQPAASSAPASARPPAQQALFLGPDGKLQAATTINRAIALVATLPTGVQALVLSPNGGSLAFVHDGQVFVRALNASTDTRVVSATLEARDIAFAPDGRSLLYAIDTSEDALNQPQPQLYVSQLDGQPARLLGPGFAPVWSLTGDQIAFIGPPFESNPVFGGGPGGRVMLAARDGSHARVVGDSEAVHPGWQPIIWSSDGTRLAAGSELIDGTTGAVITHAAVSKGAVVSGIQSIAPDGHSFAFWSNVRSGDAQNADTFTEHEELSIVSDDGQAHRVAQTTPKECPCLPIDGQLRPVWSVDSDRFVVADPRLSVRLYTGDGLPMGGRPIPKGTQSGGAFGGGMPFWSEDGEALLLTLTTADGHNEAWILHTQDGTWRRLGAGVALGWRN